jgi:hypothetical protein
MSYKKEEYAFQSPFISLIPLTDEEKDKIFEYSLKVWNFINEKVGYEYFPVLTIFASEKAVRLLKHLVHGTHCIINKNCENCIRNIESFIRKHGLTIFGTDDVKINENIPLNPCQVKRNELIWLIASIDQLTSAQIHELIGLGANCSEFPGTLDFMLIDEIFQEWRKNLTNDKRMALFGIINGANIKTWIFDDNEKIKEIFFHNLKKFTSIFDLLEIETLRAYLSTDYHFYDRLKKIIIKEWLSALIEKCFIEKEIMISEKDELTPVYIDAHSKFGCYLPPKYWEWLRKSGKYEMTLRLLGLPDNVILFDRPCVFIYPFPIRRDYQEKFENISSQPLWELFNIVLVHEHGHASFRHALTKTGKNEKLIFLLKDKDATRKLYPWIEEGLAMEMEYYYILEMMIGDPNQSTFLKLTKDYVEAKRDLKEWPYSGKIVIDKYISIKKKEIQSLKTSCIQIWKNNPESLALKLDFIRLREHLP